MDLKRKTRLHIRLLRDPVKAKPATIADWTPGIYIMLDLFWAF